MDPATIGIWISLILIGAGLVIIVIFGIKSLAEGKLRLMSLGAMAIPVVVFAISYLVSTGAEHPFSQAAILTSLILLFGAGIAILVSGLRSLVGF